jgi:hypothetical protein
MRILLALQGERRVRVTGEVARKAATAATAAATAAAEGRDAIVELLRARTESGGAAGGQWGSPDGERTQ